MTSPQPKYITFLSFPEYRVGHHVGEDLYKAEAHHSQIVMVDRGDLEAFRKSDYRIMGIMPGVVGNRDRGFDCDKRRDSLRKFAGYPRFNFGQYYNLDCLLLMDDVIEYNHHRREFKDVRTARDLVKQNGVYSK